ncbi:dnaJ homolog subfamily C member 24 isoform X2 [Xiphophorus maculatus]|uniref:dnaJ homolog subfamily C member 24 isoform X2 n=1 Tax=Xiphophorus maculatus TaxID=8083 RepID=UPI000C6E0BA2|nr:dnaJ homolog subfamily C member 24 isoform X2 [Xiphophorus maculatus]
MCDPEQKDLYAVLGGSPSDSLQQLRHRYQQLALKYHPDRLGGENSAESSVKTFLEVDAAWKILGDQTTRREYDLQRRAQELKQDWTVDSTVDLEDMTWEMGVNAATAAAVEEHSASQRRRCRRRHRGGFRSLMSRKCTEERRAACSSAAIPAHSLFMSLGL